MWRSRGARAHRQFKKKKKSHLAGGWGGGEGVWGGLGRRSHAGQSKWWTAVRSVLRAPMYMQSSLTCELSQLPSGFQVNTDRPELCSGLSPPRRARVFVFVYGNRVFLGPPPPHPCERKGWIFLRFYGRVSWPRVCVLQAGAAKFVSVIFFSPVFILPVEGVWPEKSVLAGEINSIHISWSIKRKTSRIRHRLSSKDTVKWAHNCSPSLWANIIILFSYAFHLALSA